jgi:prevent-host-death family protein
MTESVLSPSRSEIGETVGVHEAKTRLSELLRQVEAGAQITVRRGNQPVARLVPVPRTRNRVFGSDAGVFEVPEDFDAPLNDEELAVFEA